MKISLLKKPTGPSKKARENKLKYEAHTEDYVETIRKRQHVLYAQSKYSLLIVLQGMDASGKDGATKAVFSSVNPQGVSVTSFKKPNEVELSHDFLWRIHQQCPERGMIKVFNRSHYEDVLIPMVYKTLGKKEIGQRFAYINAFEDMLRENNTTVMKFYLHISEAEQKKRFKERLSNPEKNWKYNAADKKTARYWPEFRNAYENIFDACDVTPWHIIPSDSNWYKKYLITKIIADTLCKMALEFPKLNGK